MKIKEIINHLEQIAPRSYQESYDNSGLLVGDSTKEVTGVCICLDVTEAVIEEAIEQKENLIIAHHPLIFGGLKTLTGKHWVERCVIKAIQNNIAIYAIHTNLDNVLEGVNARIARKLNLQNTRILHPKANVLSQLVTFVPVNDQQQVLSALFDAGAGQVGNYANCSFTTQGIGGFTPQDGADPFQGAIGKQEQVDESRIEVLLPSHLENQILDALRKSHPYEEVAFYLSPLHNVNQTIGSGIIGELPTPIDAKEFLADLKVNMQTDCVRHTAIHQHEIQKIAVCGGSGRFLLNKAIQAGADVLVTADFKYHDFFEADNQIIVADIGHYESEQFTKGLLYDILQEKFTNIALRLTEVKTNPINYL